MKVNLSRLWHTIKYLKPVQIRYRIWYGLRNAVRSKSGFKYSQDIYRNGYPLSFSPWIDKKSSLAGKEFRFLNQKKEFQYRTINWDDETYGKLWAYNMNYMDYLLQPGMDRDEGTELIDSFINGYENNQTGKEPYTIALRGINWIKFFSGYEIKYTRFESSLYAQYCILLDNIEYHLMGNHLLEDGFSLLFGAFYFHDNNFFSKAKNIILSQLKEQVLNDGGHFELSPMYHQIILDRLLDCINLMINNEVFVNQHRLLSNMKSKAKKMISWLKNMTFSDGSIPLFNDSSYEIAPGARQLIAYAERLGIETNKTRKLSDSGYRRFDGDNYECIIDAGKPGPSYIPGHAHADTFNFHLQLKNRPFIVDKGVSTYDKNERRLKERGTAAHNTVEVNRKNSSDIWEGFRVGKRAKVIQFSETDTIISATHNGYKDEGVLHKREFIKTGGGFIISDHLIGEAEYTGIARFHFHPGIDISLKGSEIEFEGGRIEFANFQKIHRDVYLYSPLFNTLTPATCIELKFRDHLTSAFYIE